jgi:hypothetical protein
MQQLLKTIVLMLIVSSMSSILHDADSDGCQKLQAQIANELCPMQSSWCWRRGRFPKELADATLSTPADVEPAFPAMAPFSSSAANCTDSFNPHRSFVTSIQRWSTIHLFQHSLCIVTPRKQSSNSDACFFQLDPSWTFLGMPTADIHVNVWMQLGPARTKC